MSKWTDIKDRMPRNYTGTYWVTYEDGTVHLGFLRPDGKGFRAKNVIAWMPYPKEPKPYKRPQNK